MADGTVKQINPFTGTVVWTVPGRGHRPVDHSPGEVLPVDPHAAEAYCAFCVARLRETTPEKSRLVRDGETWKTLDRVAAHDLGNPGAAQVEVHDSGVLLRRRGATDLFVPAARLRGVGTAPGMAGKFMGGDGLVVLTWDAGADRLLDTGVLVRHRDERPALVAAVQALIPGEAA